MRVSLGRVAIPLVGLLVFAPACGGDDAPESTTANEGAAAIDTTAAVESSTAESSIEAESGTASSPTDLGAPASTAPSGPLPAGPDVVGVTDDVIRLGVTTQSAEETADTAAQVGGADDYEVASYDEANQAAVDAINAAGGIAGRKVELVVYTYDTANLTTRTGRQQEVEKACALWTQDNEVFAFAQERGYDESAADCAANTSTPWIRTGTGVGLYLSQERFDTMPNLYYAPNSLLADRREAALVNFMSDNGFFDEGAGSDGPKVGIFVAEDQQPGVDAAMKPALEALGIEPVVEIVYPDPIDSPWNNYVLQLQEAGVTHVLFSSVVVGLPQLFMMRAAEEQQYRPLWATGSDFGAYSYETLIPEPQLANTWIMGWNPVVDIADSTPQSDVAALCADTLKARGVIEPPGQNWAGDHCEFFFFLKAAFEHADELSVEGLAQGVAALGDSYQSVTTHGGATQFSADRHDGVAVVRLARFDTSTKHFAYVTEATPIP